MPYEIIIMFKLKPSLAEALEKVASKFLEDMDMEDEVRRNCVTMCGYFHESVRLVRNTHFWHLHNALTSYIK
jgi:dynein heavy chain